MTNATGDLWKRLILLESKHFYLTRNTKECAESHARAETKKKVMQRTHHFQVRGSYEKVMFLSFDIIYITGQM